MPREQSRSEIIDSSMPVWVAQTIDLLRKRFHPDGENCPDYEDVEATLATDVDSRVRELVPTVLVRDTQQQIDEVADNIISNAHRFIADRAAWVFSPPDAVEFDEHKDCNHNYDPDDDDAYEELESCEPDPYGIEFGKWLRQQNRDIYEKLVELVNEAYRENYRHLGRWNRNNPDRRIKRTRPRLITA